MLASISAGFVFGLVGSMHCIGMCGPLIMAIPFQRIQSNSQKAMAYILYGSGKTLAYMCLGLLVGMIGSKAQQLHAQRYVSIIAGSLLLLSILIPLLFKNKQLKPAIIVKFTTWVNQRIANQFRDHRLHSFGIIGFLNGLLPCGMVYAAIAVAVVAGSVAQSMAFMLFFGIATMLSLTVFSVFFQKLPFRVRNTIRRLFPYIIVVTAILLILRGLELGIPMISPVFDAAGGKCGHSCCGG